MKIQTENPQPAVARQAEKAAEARESGAAANKGAEAAKGPRDWVELSASLDHEIKKEEAEQAKRVEAIRAQIAAGEYRVSSRDVAEKILAALGESPDEPGR